MNGTELLVGTGYGRTVGLRVPDVAAAAVASALPFWWTPAEGRPELVWDVEPADTAGSAVRVVRAMELWVAEHAVDVVFVHAGVVAIDGRALLMPGRSTAGKTTLTAALLTAGADYLSDEYAVLDPSGRVHPYPRPLSVRSGSDRHAVAAIDYGARTVTEPLPVAAVALLVHLPGAAWDPHPLTAADAALRVLDNTVSARAAPVAALDTVLAALHDARVIEGERDGTAGVVSDLFALLDPAVRG